MRNLVTILGHVRQLWPLYFGIVVCSVLNSATTLASPFVLQWVVDEITAGQAGLDWRPMAIGAALLLAAELANTLISNIGGYLGDTMAADCVRSCRDFAPAQAARPAAALPTTSCPAPSSAGCPDRSPRPPRSCRR